MAAVDEFVQQLRRRQIEGSTATAKRTAEILRLLVTKSRRPTPEGMLEDVHFVGMRMQAAKPLGAHSPQCRRRTAQKRHETIMRFTIQFLIVSSDGMRMISTHSIRGCQSSGAANEAGTMVELMLRSAAVSCAWFQHLCLLQGQRENKQFRSGMLSPLCTMDKSPHGVMIQPAADEVIESGPDTSHDYTSHLVLSMRPVVRTS